MQVRVIERFEELAGLADVWDAFMASIGGEVFLTYDWCRIWWRHYGEGRSLRILLMEEPGGLVAILPLFLEQHMPPPLRVRVAKFVGADHAPVTFSLPARADRLAAVAAALRTQLDAWGVDLLVVGDLAGKYTEAPACAAALCAALAPRYTVALRVCDRQTYFDLAADWETQLERLSKQERKRMRHVYRDLSAAGLSVETQFATLDNLDDFFDRFQHAHQARWHAAGRAGHFRAWPRAPEFHREVARAQARHGRLRLLQIVLHGRDAGFKYGYRFGSMYSVYLDARVEAVLPKEVSFGRLGFAELVKQAMAEGGVTLYDSMRGDYEHKQHLGGRLEPIHRILAIRSAWPACVRVALLRIIAWLVNRVYVKVWRRRVAPRMGLGQGAFAAFWLKTNMFAS